MQFCVFLSRWGNICCSQSNNIHLCPGGLGFKSRSREWLSWHSFCSFAQSLQAKNSILLHIKSWPFLSQSFLTSLIVVSFDATDSHYTNHSLKKTSLINTCYKQSYWSRPSYRLYCLRHNHLLFLSCPLAGDARTTTPNAETACCK